MVFAAASSSTVVLPFHSHASVVLVVGAVATFFWWAFTRLGPTVVAPGEAVVTTRQKQWIVAGLAWTFVFSSWPIHDISERYLFLFHMTQHTVFTFVAPACFLLGSPPWLWRWAMSHRRVAPVVRFLSKPLVALLVFNALIVATHYPPVVEKSLHNEWFHFSVHTVLFAAATFMWIPVINRIEGLPRLKAPTKMVYLFAQSIVPTVPASFLTFSDTPLYKTYGLAPRMIHGLDALGDQQIAAAIMKIGGGGFLWGIVAYLFSVWHRDTLAGLADDNVLATGEARVAPTAGKARVRPQIAGMTIGGGRVGEVSESAGVLTWAQVKAELEGLMHDRVLIDDADTSA